MPIFYKRIAAAFETSDRRFLNFARVTDPSEFARVKASLDELLDSGAALIHDLAEIHPQRSAVRHGLNAVVQTYRHLVFSTGQREIGRFLREAQNLVPIESFYAKQGHALQVYPRFLNLVANVETLLAWNQLFQSSIESGQVDLAQLEHVLSHWNTFADAFEFYMAQALGKKSGRILDLTLKEEWVPLHERITQDLAHTLLPMLARQLHCPQLAEETDYHHLLLAIRLKHFGFAPLRYGELDPQYVRARLEVRPTYVNEFPSEDDLSQMEALYQSGVWPMIICEDDCCDERYCDGRLRVYVKQAIVRGPDGWYMHRFKEPVLVHYGEWGYADMPGPSSDFHDQISDSKDLAQRLLQAQGVRVPETVWLPGRDHESGNRFTNALHAANPLETWTGGHPGLLLKKLKARGWDQVVLKPDNSNGGVGVRIGSLHDSEFAAWIADYVGALLKTGQGFLIQQRIEPPYLSISGALHDWNLRVFITRTVAGDPLVAPAVVRHRRSGEPVNISIDAQVLTMPGLRKCLGLDAADFETLQQAIDSVALATYRAVAAAVAPYTPQPLDWCGIDIIVRREAGRWLPYVIEVNGDGAGAMWDLGNAAGDLTLACRDWAQGVMVRAQAYKQKVAGEDAQLGVKRWKNSGMRQDEKYWLRKLEQNPDDKSALWELVEMYVRQNRFKKAQPMGERLVALVPRHADYWDYLGVALANQKKWAEALPCFEKAWALGLRTSRLSINLARACRELGQQVPAQRYYRYAVRQDPQSFAIGAEVCGFMLEQRQWPQARRQMKVLLGDMPANDPGICTWIDDEWALGMELADKIFSSGQSDVPLYAEFLTQFELWALREKEPEMLAWLLNHYLDHNDPVRAIRALANMLELDDKNPEAELMLAKLYYEQGWDIEAQELAQGVLEQDPDAIGGYEILILALLAQERFEEAFQGFLRLRRARPLNPEDAGIIPLLTELSGQLMVAGCINNAVEVVSEILRLKPELVGSFRDVLADH